MVSTGWPQRTEQEQVEDWRERMLLEAGYPADHALALSRNAEVNLHQALALLAHGCDVLVAVDILS